MTMSEERRKTKGRKEGKIEGFGSCVKKKREKRGRRRKRKKKKEKG